MRGTAAREFRMGDDAHPELAPVRPGESLDWPALERYLLAELPELSGGMSVLQFPNGSANLTYQVAFGERRLVVRRPPFGAIAAGAHDMHREYRVLSRLHTAYERAPRALLYCDDVAVIGAPFLVSEYRQGVVVWDRVPVAMSIHPDAGRRIGFAVVDALADLHRVAPQACGLEGLGRSDGYLERQVRGWTARWRAVATEPNTVVDRVAVELARTIPQSGPPAIIHNDFKVDNCQFPPDDPDRVISVFDWEMATLGDALTDLGTLLNYWPEPGGDAAIGVPGLDTLGLPSRAEVVARYAERTGWALTLADLAWYEALGCWKTAVILQQLYARHLRGETTDPRMAERGENVQGLARRAMDLLNNRARRTSKGRGSS